MLRKLPEYVDVRNFILLKIYFFQDNSLVFRALILFGGGIFAVFGSNAAKLPGAGALGCLTLSFTAALGWRKRDQWGDQVSFGNLSNRSLMIQSKKGLE